MIMQRPDIREWIAGLWKLQGQAGAEKFGIPVAQIVEFSAIPPG